jgi:integrase/recombinase XerD
MTLFEQFIRERQFLHNVSPRTAQWYRESLKWLNDEKPDQQALKLFVIRMRERGLKASSCNNRIRAVNAYLHWSDGSDLRCGAGCQHLRVPNLKQEKRVLPTFNVDDVRKFSQWKPRTSPQRRLQVLVLTLCDTGCRISEALSLRWSDVDFDNLLLTLHGKGSQDRKVPFSFELRRVLFRWKQNSECELVFYTRSGRMPDRRVMLRDVKRLCARLGITIPERTLHAFRHTFALHYLRNGGSTFHLQKCLGHSSLEMTRRYANLMTEDLSAIHQRVSLLNVSNR